MSIIKNLKDKVIKTKEPNPQLDWDKISDTRDVVALLKLMYGEVSFDVSDKELDTVRHLLKE